MLDLLQPAHIEHALNTLCYSIVQDSTRERQSNHDLPERLFLDPVEGLPPAQRLARSQGDFDSPEGSLGVSLFQPISEGRVENPKLTARRG
jgi:hypothetical protein